jgi:hypothetical protein
VASAVLLLAVTCDVSPPEAPPRAPGVPQDAVWAGGPDGGAWIECDRSPASRERYSCTTYHEDNGEIWARGDFVLRRVEYDPAKSTPSYVAVSPLTGPLDYDGFDGATIILGDNLILLPDGWIDFPFGNGSGKRIRFQAGKELEEVSYGEEPRDVPS